MLVDGESRPSVDKIELVASLPGHSDRAWQVTWSPRSRLLASCSTDKTVRLWSFTGSGAAASFSSQGSISTGHARTVRSLAFSPSGQSLALASFDSTVSIWERSPASDADDNGDGEWECVSTLEGHDSECKAVAWSASGSLLASCSRDKSVWVWEVQPEADFECLAVMLTHSQDVKTVLFHPTDDNLLASASYDDTIRLASDNPVADWESFQTLEGHGGTVWDLAFEPKEGRWLASAGDEGEIRFWERRGEETESPWRSATVFRHVHSRTIYSLSWIGNSASTSTSASEAVGTPADGVDSARDVEGVTTTGRRRSLGRLASGGGDGFVRVFEVWLVDSSSADASPPTIDLVQTHELEEAHGVAEVNSVAFAPILPSAAGGGGEEEVQGGGKALLASAGDDGVIKVWAV